jgi:hypothetical protein
LTTGSKRIVLLKHHRVSGVYRRRAITDAIFKVSGSTACTVRKVSRCMRVSKIVVVSG